MPEIVLGGVGGVIESALSVVTIYGGYIMVGLAIAVAPRLLKLGFRVLKGRG